MIDLNMMLRPRTVVGEQVREDSSEEALLVAALAATLVEYRRYVDQRNSQRRLEGAASNWRTMARMEQLRV